MLSKYNRRKHDILNKNLIGFFFVLFSVSVQIILQVNQFTLCYGNQYSSAISVAMM